MTSRPTDRETAHDTDQADTNKPDDETVLESLGEAISAPIFGADEQEPGEPKDRVRERAKP